MDDKGTDNNQIIDFSNQPLGLMAQEGEQIENRLNNEQRLNAATAVNNPNVQDNPFQNLSDAVNSQQAMPSSNMDNPFAQPMEQQVQQAAPQPVEQQSAPQVEQKPKFDTQTGAPIPQEPTPTPEQPKFDTQTGKPIPPGSSSASPEVKSETPQGSGSNTIPVPPQPKKEATPEVEESNGAFLMFFILIAFVVGAVFLFKSGKLDEMLGKDDETQEVAKEDKKEETPVEEQKPAEEVPTPVENEAVRNYKIKEVEFVSFKKEKMTITYTTAGVVDLENKATEFSVVININGMTSRSFAQYFDMKNNVAYTKNSYNTTKDEWLKESTDSIDPNPDNLLKLIESYSNKQEVSPNNYKVTVTGNDLTKFLNKSEYFNPKKVKNEKLVIEYTKENGRLKKIKYDFSNAYTDKNVTKMILSQEFSDYNTNEHVTIPSNIVKNAKKA